MIDFPELPWRKPAAAPAEWPERDAAAHDCPTCAVECPAFNEGVAAERERIVAWLREWARDVMADQPVRADYLNGCVSGISNAALLIERGEHER